jgi:hypothetical protein
MMTSATLQEFFLAVDGSGSAAASPEFGFISLKG